jgi:hypothetical protein
MEGANEGGVIDYGISQYPKDVYEFVVAPRFPQLKMECPFEVLGNDEVRV